MVNGLDVRGGPTATRSVSISLTGCRCSGIVATVNFYLQSIHHTPRSVPLSIAVAALAVLARSVGTVVPKTDPGT